MDACGDPTAAAKLTNPIVKVPVVLTGDEGTVYIDVIPEDLGDGEGIIGAGSENERRMTGGIGNQSVRNQLLALQSGIMAIRRDQATLKTDIGEVLIANARNFDIMNGNIKRIALQPARRVDRSGTLEAGNAVMAGVDAGDGTGGDRTHAVMIPAASLMPTPRSLYDLWQEYQHGIGGRKPARLFSHSERGHVKHKYHRRKIVWDIVSGIVRQGHTSDAAIDRLHAIYGAQTSVTNIINGLKRDKKNGTLSPNLRV